MMPLEETQILLHQFTNSRSVEDTLLLPAILYRPSASPSVYETSRILFQQRGWYIIAETRNIKLKNMFYPPNTWEYGVGRYTET